MCYITQFLRLELAYITLVNLIYNYRYTSWCPGWCCLGTHTCVDPGCSGNLHIYQVCLLTVPNVIVKNFLYYMSKLSEQGHQVGIVIINAYSHWHSLVL